MSDLRDRDRAARAIAQREFCRPLVVEAGAGTGKTSILVARIVAWVLGDGWRRAESAGDADAVAGAVLEGVVAITFTEAAAAEMATRVAEGLRALEEGTVPPWLDAEALPAVALRSQRARALLGALHRLRVSTIHAFCASLLRQLPVEAGVAPGFTVDASGTLLEETVREVVEGGLRRAFGGEGNPRPWLALAAAGIGPERVAEALAALAEAGAPRDLLARDPFAAGARAAGDELAGAAADFATAGGARLQDVARSATVTRDSAAAVVALPALLAELPDDDGLGSWAALVAAVRGLGVGVRARIRSWGTSEKSLENRFKPIERSALGDDLERVAAAAGALHSAVTRLVGLAPVEFDAARRALAPLLEEVVDALRRDGVLSYQMLLAGAAELLERPGIAARVRSGVRQLLVDEFQDTDQLQCTIVRRLAVAGPEDLRPGLFVVGDPKQSIYGWRNADLGAYEAFVADVVAAGGEVHPLAVNFRSVPAVLAEVERAVAPVMRREPGLQPAFEPLLACDARAGEAGFVAEGRAPVEYWVAWPEDEPGAGRRRDVVEVQARALAAELAELHAREGVPWGDAAVLLRSFGDVDTVLEALREAGVPYQVPRDREYFRSREVTEAAALVRAVLDPADELALLTVLRSDTVGVPDAALLPLWRAGLPAVMARLGDPEPSLLAAAEDAVRRAAAEVPAEQPGVARVPGWEIALQAAVHALAALRRSFAEDPPDRFVELLRTLWLSEATAAARYLGGFRRARLERFLRDVEEVLGEGTSPAVVERFLRRRVAEERELDERVVAEGDADVVQVLTIHGAKGLDFGHVYLLDLDKQVSQPGRSRREAELVDADSLAYRLLRWPTPAALATEERERQVEAAERVRLLYVAMTRAKDRLVLTGRWPAEPADREPASARSMLDLVAHRGAAPVLASVTTTGVRDPEGALWRRCPEPRRVARSAEGCGPTAAPLLVTTKEREAAARRQARPWSAAASAEAHLVLQRETTEETELPAGADGGRDAALAAGTFVHRTLEALALDDDPAAHLIAASEAVAAREAEGLEPEGTAARVRELVAALTAGPLLERLQALAPHVVARELPVLLPAGDDGGPVGFIAGAVDLVYRDAGGDGLVVVDYKTDRVADEGEVTARAAVYAPQLRLYRRALQEALGLAGPPRAELWFLAAGVVVPVD